MGNQSDIKNFKEKTAYSFGMEGVGRSDYIEMDCYTYWPLVPVEATGIQLGSNITNKKDKVPYVAGKQYSLMKNNY
ncbi:hypothetical protein PALU110988_10745 [Paenibacillus lupini]|uniref:hypothetical protein n=1 Tax=Paenibacillus lupini TaxID=1450204 RepID=UPI00141DD601|nr:hypothetical protein [Paenibacillus lupini]NIK22377.1 hypothetical protein [Paenibacillus lupini]